MSTTAASLYLRLANYLAAAEQNGDMVEDDGRLISDTMQHLMDKAEMPEELETQIKDTLTDIFHICWALGFDVEELISRARFGAEFERG